MSTEDKRFINIFNEYYPFDRYIIEEPKSIEPTFDDLYNNTMVSATYSFPYSKDKCNYKDIRAFLELLKKDCQNQKRISCPSYARCTCGGNCWLMGSCNPK